jgi:hypothetical protein
MSIYYEKLIDLYEAGKIQEVIACFEKWKAEGRLSREEIRQLNNMTPSWLEHLEGNLDFNNSEIILRFYYELKEMKRCSDEALCKEYGISKENLKDIKQGRRLKSKKIGDKIARELFRLLRNYGQKV